MLEKGEGGERANVASATVIIVSLLVFSALTPRVLQIMLILAVRT